MKEKSWHKWKSSLCDCEQLMYQKSLATQRQLNGSGPSKSVLDLSKTGMAVRPPLELLRQLAASRKKTSMQSCPGLCPASPPTVNSAAGRPASSGGSSANPSGHNLCLKASRVRCPQVALSCGIILSFGSPICTLVKPGTCSESATPCLPARTLRLTQS